MENFLLELGKQGIAFGILVWIILDKRKENKDLKQENKELNLIIRDQQKDVINAINKISDSAEASNEINEKMLNLLQHGEKKKT